MIGQQQLLDEIDKFVASSDNRFIIICGVEGSGKKQVMKYLARQLKAELTPNENKVDSVRQCIKTCYSQTNRIIYAFYDVDKMSFGAKNSLLKITEEPPKKAFFGLTVTNRWTVPATLLSRATVFNMQHYTTAEIADYANSLKAFTIDELEVITQFCKVPGEVKLLAQNSIKDFNEFADLVFNNIAEVSGANAFKISQKLKLKADGVGYDIKFFLRVMANLFINNIDKKNYSAWKLTVKALNELGVTGINKQFLIDRWILDIRDNFLED